MDTRYKLLGRGAALVLAAGMTLCSVAVLGYTPAYAASPGAVSIVTSGSGDDSLAVILPQPQRALLADAVRRQLTAEEKTLLDSGTPLAITLSAAPAQTLPEAVETAIKNRLGNQKPLLQGDLLLHCQLDGMRSARLATLDDTLEVTLSLPEALWGYSAYTALVFSGETVQECPDLDSTPNTITIATADFGGFALVGGSMPAPPAVQPEPTPAPEPVPTLEPAPARTTLPGRYCSRMPTTAYTGGWIDYESTAAATKEAREETEVSELEQ